MMPITGGEELAMTCLRSAPVRLPGNVPGTPASRNIRLPAATRRRTPPAPVRSEIAAEMPMGLDHAVCRRTLLAAGLTILLPAAAGPAAAQGVITLGLGEAAIVFMVLGQGRTGDIEI